MQNICKKEYLKARRVYGPKVLKLWAINRWVWLETAVPPVLERRALVKLFKNQASFRNMPGFLLPGEEKV